MAPDIMYASALAEPFAQPKPFRYRVASAEPAGFAKWLLQPDVLKEWFDTANAHRPEARMPVGTSINWNMPNVFSHNDESHLRWARCTFEDFSLCLVTEEPPDPLSSDPRMNYMMELWLARPSEAFSQLVRVEGREMGDYSLQNLANRPVWSSYMLGNCRLDRWWDGYHSTHLEELTAMNARVALDYPTTLMINPAKYYWLRLREFARARNVAMYWWGLAQEAQCVEGGAGRRADRAAWDEDDVFGSG